MTDIIRLRWIVSDAVTNAECRTLMHLLDTEERRRADRFRFAEDRRDFIAAHALKRACLSEATGRPPQSLSFAVGPYGKPALDLEFGDPALAFNLSHTRGCAVVAWGEDAMIGVDVEALTRPVPEGVAESHFAPNERAELHCGLETERDQRFYTIWTLKEAYMKATGFGMHLPLDSFAVALDPPRLLFGADTEQVSVWRFHVERILPHHTVALAIGRGSPVEAVIASDAVEADLLVDLAQAV